MSSSTDNINNLAHSLEPINLSDFDCDKESKKQRPSGPKSCLDSACFKNRSCKRLLSGRGFQTVSSLGSSESSSTTSTIYHCKVLQATRSYCHPVICRFESPRLKVVISQPVKPERNLNEGKRRRKGKPNYCNTAFCLCCHICVGFLPPLFPYTIHLRAIHTGYQHHLSWMMSIGKIRAAIAHDCHLSYGMREQKKTTHWYL